MEQTAQLGVDVVLGAEDPRDSRVLAMGVYSLLAEYQDEIQRDGCPAGAEFVDRVVGIVDDEAARLDLGNFRVMVAAAPFFVLHSRSLSRMSAAKIISERHMIQ